MLSFSDGSAVPALGQGTWRMGEEKAVWQREVEALKHGVELGLQLIDTAEMYGDGAAETLVGQAIAGQRERVYLVSKVLPSNAGYRAVLKACDRSRRRLDVDTIDLYLLHWPSATPLAETIDAFESLRSRGAIGNWGVSNFDTDALTELLSTGLPGQCIANQVYYSLGARGIEFDLAPLMRANNMSLMAYCPLDQGSLCWHEQLLPIAERHEASCAQVALAWLLSRGAYVIPKSSDPGRVAENAGARDLKLSSEDMANLDAAFMPPQSAQSLQIV